MTAVVCESPSSLVVWCAESTVFALDRAYAAGQLLRVLEPVRVRPTMQDRGEALANFF